MANETGGLIESELILEQFSTLDCRLDCELLRSHLEEAIAASEPLSVWRVTETPCGLIAAFARENDAEKLLQRGDLGRVFGGPVQVQNLYVSS